MKNFLSEAFDTVKRLEISKKYDCKTELKRSGEKEPYFAMQLKGDFTIKPIHIVVGAAAVALACLISSMSSMIKHRSCCKKG